MSKISKLIFVLLFLFSFSLSACAGNGSNNKEGEAIDYPATLSAQATEIVETIYTELTATAPTPAPLPTEAPVLGQAEENSLSPSEIYEQIAPALAFVETDLGTGSGILLDNGYILTNAHVVWPFRTVRLVFADGTELLDQAVVATDEMVDLALVGPVDVDIAPISLDEADGFNIGSDVYLVGYPGEGEKFPQPTLARGLIARTREWDRADVTYFQTDAAISGGQSGGALISEAGELIGITTFTLGSGNFGLASATADLIERVASLENGTDLSGLGDRNFLVGDEMNEVDAVLETFWSKQMYLVEAEAGVEFTVEIDSDADLGVDIVDTLGSILDTYDDGTSGVEEGTFVPEYTEPHFIVVYQFDEGSAEYTLTSSADFIPFSDPDEGKILSIGETIAANIDYPVDYDVFILPLEEDQTVTITADGLGIDPYIIIDYLGASFDDTLQDDDSAGGVFGLNATLEFTAPATDDYYIVISDSPEEEVGGYFLTVSE